MYTFYQLEFLIISLYRRVLNNVRVMFNFLECKDVCRRSVDVDLDLVLMLRVYDCVRCVCTCCMRVQFRVYCVMDSRV